MGEDFSERDDAEPTGVVVNQAFARKYFSEEVVLGKRIQPGAGHYARCEKSQE